MMTVHRDDTATTAPVEPAAARSPTAPAAAHYLAAVCALGLIALGAVGIRDGIAAAGWIGGTLWTQTTVNWIDGQTFHAWMVPLGVVSMLLGVCCVVVAVWPRRTKAIPVAARTSVYLDLSDTARMAAAAAESVPGVIKATAAATPGKVRVRARTTGADAPDMRAAISDAVRKALQPLVTTPKIVVRTAVEKSS